MDQIFRFYGSGRDPHTRAKRRLAGFKQRAVAVGGDISIRPGRRNDVAVGTAVPHVIELTRLMRLGILRVFAANNVEYTPDTFATTCAAFRDGVVPTPVASSPPPPPPADEPESASEPEVAAVETLPAPPELTPEPVLEPEPVEPTPEPVPEVDREGMLPDGWRMKSNAALSDIMNGLGIALPEKITKANLISAVEAWIG